MAASYTIGENYQYEYDAVGNRLQQIIEGDTTTYLYDAANRLASVTHQAVTQTYTFDDNGNLLNTGVMTNSFDAANRLVSSSREGTTVEPIYNGVGDRVGQTIGATTAHFALDVKGLPEVIYTGEGELYLHLPGVIVTEKEGEVRYLLSDGLGSVRQAMDETGAVVAYNEFDPYGNPVQNTSGSEPYGYTGEWYESYIDLLFLRARWYAPENGTFLSRDRVESEPPYQYVQGNPINFIDPSGYCRPRPGQTSCVEIFQTDGGTIQGTTNIIGETSSETFEAGGVIIQETKLTLGVCTNATEGLCYNPPIQQRPTLQPLLNSSNRYGNLAVFPLSLAGATTQFAVQGDGLYSRVRYTWNLPPQIEILPRGTIRSVPTNFARASTAVSVGIPVIIGVMNSGEIQLRVNAGEISLNQGGWQQGVNVVATAAGAGGALAVPAGATYATGAIAGVFGVAEAPVLVPATVAAIGGVCLAYDISIIQGTANRMIEGQPLWFAYLDAREETHQVLFFGFDPLK